ncbi:AfsR/SARP family transcriptional regulator [Terrabacter aeriphilus]|uniref:AfsR/SARP family transcriptional regulator n=1 Tax=Terrabacter aeriphilus TaxID=515662 RepID=UPI0031EE8B72
MTEVRLLGPVRVVVNGTERPVGGAKQSAVLAVLALRSPRLASTDQLIDAVWGSAPPESARTAVQVYVSGLRKVLGGDAALIERDGDAYRLVGPSLAVDVTDFERGVSEGRSALRAGDPVRAARLLDDALSLWRGSPLSGLESLPFHADSGRALDDTRVAALVDRADGLLRSGALEDAIRVARQVTIERPFEERAWCLLATARYHAGRQAEALDTCSEVRRRLGDELGIDPSPELAALELSILRQDLEPPLPPSAPAERGAVPDAAATGLPALPEPFVGRDDLVAAVVERLGTARLVNLVGLGGIGKTSVAVAVGHRWSECGRPVVFCELESESEPSGALDRLCRQLGIDPGDDPAEALAVVEAGTVVVLDNIEQVEGLGAVLVGILEVGRLTILATSRRPLRVRDEVVVPVAPLSLRSSDGRPSPAAELFLERVGRVRASLDRTAAIEAGERVCAALDGIPLAIGLVAARARVLTVEQIAARLEAGGDSGLERTRRRDGPARQASLAAVVVSSIEALEPTARELLPRVAELDGWMSLDLVETVFGPAPGGSVIDAVEDLVDAGLADHDDDGRVRLRRPIREFVRRRTDGSRPVDATAVVARVRTWVEGLTPPLLDRHDDAVLALVARDQDPLRGALARARDLELADELAALVLALHRYWLLSGRITEARRWIEAACGLAGSDGVNGWRLQVLRGTFAAYAGDPEAEAILAAALDRVGTDPDGVGPVDRVLVNGWCVRAAISAQRDAIEDATAAAAAASALAAASADPTLLNLANDITGYVAAYAGDFAAALEAHRAALVTLRGRGDEYDVVNVLTSMVDDLVGLGRVEEALAVSEEAFDLVVRQDSVALRAQVLTLRGLALVCAVRPGEARGCLLEGLRLGRDHLPDPFQQAVRLALLAVCAAVARQDPTAARLWGAAEGLLRDTRISVRSQLPAGVVAEVDGARSRLGRDFEVRAELGGATAERVIDALLDP